MSSSIIVDQPTHQAPVDAASWVLPAFTPAFPSADLVAAAAGLLTAAPRWDGREGPRWRLVVGPGMVQVASHDPARGARTAERMVADRLIRTDLAASDLLLEHKLWLSEEDEDRIDFLAGLANSGALDWGPAEREQAKVDHLHERIAMRDREDTPGPARITGWSAKSRARMVRRLAELDYSPLFASGGTPAMVTLTYPGDWLTVAPSAAACKKHVDAFKRRFQRAYGRPLVGVWKREFQRRGAPHYHVLMVPPREMVNGENFVQWLSRTWAEVVGAERCSEARAVWGVGPTGKRVIVCCEFHRHLSGGTGVDFAEGMRARDPKRLAVYFSKHGAYSAKDYQNDAPEEWVAAGSVGRFWGIWGLDTATVAVEVSPCEALAAARTLRRWQRANGFRVQRTVWRTNTQTGQQRARKSGVWVGARMRGHAGFVVVNDGAAVVSMLAGYLDQVRQSAQRAEMVALGAEPWFWSD